MMKRNRKNIETRLQAASSVDQVPEDSSTHQCLRQCTGESSTQNCIVEVNSEGQMHPRTVQWVSLTPWNSARSQICKGDCCVFCVLRIVLTSWNSELLNAQPLRTHDKVKGEALPRITVFLGAQHRNPISCIYQYRLKLRSGSHSIGKLDHNLGAQGQSGVH